MRLTTTEIVEGVLPLLYQSPTPEGQETMVPTMEHLIVSQIERAAERVLMRAPTASLRPKSFSGLTVIGADGSGYIALPDDFLRLVRFKMDDWSRPALLLEGEAAEAMQRCRWAGVRGNPQRPAAVLTATAEGTRLEFFSCASPAAKVETALYVARPRLDSGGAIEIPPALRTALFEETSSLVECIIYNA